MKHKTKFLCLLLTFVIIFAVGCDSCSKHNPTESTANSFTITFDTVGGNDIPSKTLEANSKIELPTPKREGYDFVGWYSDSEYKEEFKAELMPEKDVTVYAKWAKKAEMYTITFDTAGGNDIPSISLEANAKIELPTPKREGYNFVGWYADKEYKEKFKTEIMPKKDITVYAKWAENIERYKITFDTKSEEAISPINLEYNAKYELPIPTKKDNAFLGWYIKEANEEKKIPQNGKSQFKQDTVLYAKWKPISECLKFSVVGDHYIVEEVKDKQIVTIDIPAQYNGKNVTELKAKSISYCKELVEIEIPTTLNKIGKSAFESSKNIKRVKISDIAAWCNINFEYYDSTPCYFGADLILNGESIRQLNIPKGVKELKINAFRGCVKIEKVELPDGLEKIGANAFSNCENLRAVNMKTGVKNIAPQAFYGCNNLVELKLPITVENIGPNAFYDCKNLPEIYISKNVINIGNAAFSMCDKLKIYCEAESKPDGWNNNWDGSNSGNPNIKWGCKSEEFNVKAI